MDKEKIISQVADDLKNHTYSGVEVSENYEIWRCKNPKSFAYAFDIFISTLGIAVVGDIDSVTFRVGKNYGMEFLAGNDVDYYIHSKVESDCKTSEFDKDYFYSTVSNILCDHIKGKLDCYEWPDWIEDKDIPYSKVKDFYEGKNNKFDKIFFYFIDSIDRAELNSYEAYNIFNEYYGIVGDNDYSFEKTSDSLRYRLYMINYAAKQIMKIKEGR